MRLSLSLLNLLLVCQTQCWYVLLETEENFDVRIRKLQNEKLIWQRTCSSRKFTRCYMQQFPDIHSCSSVLQAISFPGLLFIFFLFFIIIIIIIWVYLFIGFLFIYGGLGVPVLGFSTGVFWGFVFGWWRLGPVVRGPSAFFWGWGSLYKQRKIDLRRWKVRQLLSIQWKQKKSWRLLRSTKTQL